MTSDTITTPRTGLEAAISRYAEDPTVGWDSVATALGLCEVARDEETLKFKILLRRILEATTDAMLAEQDGDSPAKESALSIAWDKFHAAYHDGMVALGLRAENFPDEVDKG